MIISINIICICFLLLIIYQDFRERQISWLSLPALFICFLAKGIIINDSVPILTETLFNIFFIFIQLLLLTLWISLRNGKFVNIIDTHIGLGDILFFVAIAPAFHPAGFILFYLLSLFITLVGTLVFKPLCKNTSPEIPLAGAMSVLLCPCMLLPSLINEDVFNLVLSHI